MLLNVAIIQEALCSNPAFHFGLKNLLIITRAKFCFLRQGAEISWINLRWAFKTPKIPSLHCFNWTRKLKNILRNQISSLRGGVVATSKKSQTRVSRRAFICKALKPFGGKPPPAIFFFLSLSLLFSFVSRNVQACTEELFRARHPFRLDDDFRTPNFFFFAPQYFASPEIGRMLKLFKL